MNKQLDFAVDRVILEKNINVSLARVYLKFRFLIARVSDVQFFFFFLFIGHRNVLNSFIFCSYTILHLTALISVSCDAFVRTYFFFFFVFAT